MKYLLIPYVIISLFAAVFSYGLIDPNLVLFRFQFSNFTNRGLTAIIAAGILLLFFVLYFRILSTVKQSVLSLIVTVSAVLLFAYPMFSYDVFNYILTAKVAYFWKENPYLVMPVEIPNDPNLLFTRAANKLALYGPTWIGATFFPSLVGFNNVWLSIIAFKLLSIFWFGVMIWLIWKITKSWWNIAFFGLNPLVISEILINGHNDISMMVLAFAGLLLVRKNGIANRLVGLVSFIASVFVKGATLMLLPLYFVNWPVERVWKAGFWLMFGVFLATPFREELYPWYAVWFLSFAAFLPKGKAQFIHGFSIAMSLGLVFRHIPYIVTREYGGTGPLLRIIITVLPVVLFLTWKGIRKYG